MSRSRAPLSPAVHCCSSRVTSDGADAIPPCPGRKPAPTEREELPPSIGVRREAGKLTRAVSLHESVPPRREEGRLFTRSRRLYVAVPFSHVAFARVQRSRVRACAYTPGRMSPPIECHVAAFTRAAGRSIGPPLPRRRCHPHPPWGSPDSHYQRTRR